MSKFLETPKSIALLAGAVCYFFAFAVLVQIPSCVTDADEPRVVGVDGVARDVKPYTAVEQLGRDVYAKNVCWHCHSDFVRPVNGEEYRWGPVSQAGEYAHDLPHFFGTRRTGPDLHREGGLRADDWHYAHFFDPRFTVPRSVMESFPWLFRHYRDDAEITATIALLDTNGDGMVSAKIGDEDASKAPAGVAERVKALRARADSQDPFTKLDVRGVLPPAAGAVDSMWYTQGAPVGENLVTDYDGAPRPTDECAALVTYLQRRGTAIGAWREPAYAPTPQRVSPFEGVEPRPRRTADMRGLRLPGVGPGPRQGRERQARGLDDGGGGVGPPPPRARPSPRGRRRALQGQLLGLPRRRRAGQRARGPLHGGAPAQLPARQVQVPLDLRRQPAARR